MPWRYRKRIRLSKNSWVNIGKSGITSHSNKAGNKTYNSSPKGLRETTNYGGGRSYIYKGPSPTFKQAGGRSAFKPTRPRFRNSTIKATRANRGGGFPAELVILGLLIWGAYHVVPILAYLGFCAAVTIAVYAGGFGVIIGLLYFEFSNSSFSGRFAFRVGLCMSLVIGLLLPAMHPDWLLGLSRWLSTRMWFSTWTVSNNLDGTCFVITVVCTVVIPLCWLVRFGLMDRASVGHSTEDA